METLNAALKYHGMGFNVIPLEYGGKTSIVKWQDFQKRKQTEEEVRNFFSGEGARNIGIVCGEASGNLVAVDFDDMDIYNKAVRTGFLSEETLTNKSGKGIHKIYRTKKPVGCFRIDKLKIDVKGQGGYIVAPPSWHTIKARRYEWLDKLVEPKYLDTDDFRNYLLETLEETFGIDLVKQREVINIEELLQGVGQGSRDTSAIQLATWFRRSGMKEEETLAELIKWNARNKPPLGSSELETKMKSAYKPEKPYKYVFSEEPTKPDTEWKKELVNICLLQKEGKSNSIMKLFTNWILGKAGMRFLTFFDTEELFFYKDGVYVPHGGQIIKQYIQAIAEETKTEEYIRSTLVQEVILAVKRSTYFNREDAEKNPYLICLQNGVLNMDTYEFFQHSPDLKFFAKIPVNYDYKATSPKFDKFIKDVMSLEDIPIVQELFGYCLFRKYPIQKSIMLTGGGQNGKSVLLNALKTFLGKANVTALSIQDLEEKQFARSRLFGKLANIFPDLSDKALKQTGIFKALTGGDTLTADKKYQEPIDFENHAKLIFSANKLPEANDDTDAFHRRWVIITFPNTFSKEQGNLDTTIQEKITTPEELSGIMNWAIEGLRQLLIHQSFSNQKSIEETRTLYTRLSDSLAAYTDECIEANTDGSIQKEEFYASYAEWCRKNKLIPKTVIKVGRDLPVLMSVITWQMGGGKRGWKGIRFKSTNKQLNTTL